MSELARWQEPRFDPFFKGFSSLRRRFNDLFEEMDLPEMELAAGWHPVVDIFDEGNEVVLKAELPGIKKEEIHVEVENNMLTLRGEKKREDKLEKAGVYRSERVYGVFSRSFTLPGSVDPNKIEAAFKDGVLTVRLPKVEAAKPKQIAVKVS